MDPRLDSGDWEQVFGEGTYCENSMSVERAPGDDETPDGQFTREDVAEILHITEGSEEGYGEWSGAVVVRLKDGRYAALSGWCDTSGWG
jgi:hypothetical protein